MVQDVVSIITAILLAGTLVAAVWLNVINNGLLNAARAEAEEAQQTNYDRYRPILMPQDNGPSLEVKSALGYAEHLYADLSPEHLTVSLRNIGSGLALGVRGVIFGPVPRSPSEDQTPHSFRVPVPFPEGEMYNAGTVQGASGVRGTDTIGRDRRYTLYAPPRPSPKDFADGVALYTVARLIVTYQDLYGRKHATLFDYTSQKQWRSVDGGFLSGIPQDLEDLAREHARRERLPTASPQDLEVPGQ